VCTYTHFRDKSLTENGETLAKKTKEAISTAINIRGINGAKKNLPCYYCKKAGIIILLHTKPIHKINFCGYTCMEKFFLTKRSQIEFKKLLNEFDSEGKKKTKDQILNKPEKKGNK